MVFKWRTGPKKEDATYSAVKHPETALLELALFLRRLQGLRLLAAVTYNCEAGPSLPYLLASIGELNSINGLWLFNASCENKYDRNSQP